MPHHRSADTQQSASRSTNEQASISRAPSQRASSRGTHGQGTHSAPSKQPSGHARALLSRREFLYGAIGVGVVAAAAGGGAFALSQLNDSDEEEIEVLQIAEDQVSLSDSCTLVEDTSRVVSLAASYDLPYGSLLWTSNDSFAACLIPTEDSASPLCRVAALSLESGDLSYVLEAAVRQDEGYDIYDVRANEQGFMWTEANILDEIWRIYAATYDVATATLGFPVLLDEGDAVNWETPTLAAVGKYAFWQVLPTADGLYRLEQSHLKRTAFGSDGDADVLYSSTGRFCTPPYPRSNSLVITPRTNTSSVHYQLTLIDAESGAVQDKLVLPASMAPLEAGYGDKGFTFAFDATYSYGDGLGNLGSYTPAQSHDAESYTDLQWFRYARNPTAPPTWCNGFFVVKSTMQVCAVDIENMAYIPLDLESGCDDWGDYLASSGETSTLVTFSSINSTSINADVTQTCRVRVWTPLIEAGGSEMAELLEEQAAAEAAEDDEDEDD